MENRVASGKFFPDYSGGTVPDLHQLPFYALAGTQDFAESSSTAQGFGCQWDQNDFRRLLTAANDARRISALSHYSHWGRKGAAQSLLPLVVVIFSLERAG
jgi:hypothetical protein